MLISHPKRLCLAGMVTGTPVMHALCVLNSAGAGLSYPGFGPEEKIPPLGCGAQHDH